MAAAKSLMAGRSYCPVCGGEFEPPFLQQEAVPVHQNFLYRSRESARNCPRGNLSIAHCPTCDFVANTAFDGSLLTYGGDYENFQGHSGAFKDYLQELAQDLVERFSLKGKTLVEAGCGQGDFLRMICQQGGCRGLGFDPSYTGPDSDNSAGLGLEFFKKIFDEKAAATEASFIFSRHVIEHVEDPLGMVAQILPAAEKNGADLFLETPDLTWILENQAFWDFFYEHCNYFSLHALEALVSRAGFEITLSRRAFGGQYQHLFARPGNGEIQEQDASLKEAIHAFSKAQKEAQDRIQSLLATAGETVVWGAGAKGVTFLNLFDPLGERVRAVVDINPKKQGFFLPGTGHQIVDQEALGQLGPELILVMNQNYLEEIRGSLGPLGVGARALAVEQAASLL